MSIFTPDADTLTLHTPKFAKKTKNIKICFRTFPIYLCSKNWEGLASNGCSMAVFVSIDLAACGIEAKGGASFEVNVCNAHTHGPTVGALGAEKQKISKRRMVAT